MAKHGKTYEGLEKKLDRFKLFKDNLKHIDETNKKVQNFRLGLNEFADLTHDEFKWSYLGLKGTETRRESSSEEEITYKDFVGLP
ncbi:hypothetical protein MLD38_002181 [Melastoma candidum]|uniref:Uncharacterized protein n=1 Tax=Melastoma candidum TaxID=119954 RepID=A0ACB9SHL7_9MYRT|nr:hypothetical protein MLD38_002181 [Melastoma candidum]